MGDWGDYAITQVRYWDDEDERLKHVKRREIEDGSVREAEIARRRSVLFDVRSDDEYVTALKEDGKLRLQGRIEVVETDGGEYLRVDGAEMPEDYLGGLPTF